MILTHILSTLMVMTALAMFVKSNKTEPKTEAEDNKVFLITGVAVFVQWNYTDKENMGGLLSYIRWGGDPDEVNAISGLTRREVNLIQKSWAPVNADKAANGAELLRR
uniref:SFRICE_017839 n=1 Tax=Spodoptera frugiperda TaxID=7108 RepID=A0A2H1WHR9_SPOFR